jgi:hypothetical protein
MPLSNDNMHLAARLWQAVLDSSQVPEHQLEIAMSTPDPVTRMHYLEDLLVQFQLPEVRFCGGDWMGKGTKRT